jgi:hypothetical protein
MMFQAVIVFGFFAQYHNLHRDAQSLPMPFYWYQSISLTDLLSFEAVWELSVVLKSTGI